MSCCQMIVAAVRAGINHSKCLCFSGGCGGRQREKSWLCSYMGLGRGRSLLEKKLNLCVVLSPPVREKDDKYKTWMPKFLIPKEDKDQRKSSVDVERSWFLFCIFPCCLALYKHLLSRCRSGMPLIAQAFCVPLLLLQSLFPLNSAFRKLCRQTSWGQNKLLSELCASEGYPEGVSLKLYCVFPLSWEEKMLLAVSSAAFLPWSVPFLL